MGEGNRKSARPEMNQEHNQKNSAAQTAQISPARRPPLAER